MIKKKKKKRHFKELSVDGILTDDRQRQLLRLFRDTTEQSAGFSIHNIAMRGEEYGTRVGDWFGPQVACDVLRDCVQREASVDMSVYVARDATIYRNEVLQLCEQQQGEALLILVPNRLGLSELNDMYLSQLLTVFQQSHQLSLSIICQNTIDSNAHYSFNFFVILVCYCFSAFSTIFQN